MEIRRKFRRIFWGLLLQPVQYRGLDTFFLLLAALFAKSAHKQVCQPRMAVYDKVDIPVFTPGIGILLDGDRFCPVFIAGRNPSVVFFLLNGVGENVHSPLYTKGIFDFCNRSLSVQTVAAVMVTDSIFNGLLAGHIRFIGSPVLLQLPMLTCIGSGLAIQGCFSERTVLTSEVSGTFLCQNKTGTRNLSSTNSALSLYLLNIAVQSYPIAFG